jgi:ribosomal protein S18 acetylase RimI-like enzyme
MLMEYADIKPIDIDGIKVQFIEKEIFLVNDRDNKTVGFLIYDYFSDNIPFLSKLYINEGYKSKALDKKLIKIWELEMKNQGHDLVMATTLSNETEESFYKNLGYKYSGNVVLLNNPLEVIFSKKL